MPDFNTILFVVFAIGIAVFFTASAFGFGTTSPDDEVLEEAGELLATGEAKLVDVRTPREYATNGLEGAENIPVQQLGTRLDEMGPSDEPVVVYCQSGRRSAQAVNILEQNGFTQIYDLGAHSTAQKVVDDAH